MDIQKRRGRPKKYSDNDIADMKAYIEENSGFKSNDLETEKKLKLYRAVVHYHQKKRL